MLNSGKKLRASRDKKINIITLVLSEKKFLNETKNHLSNERKKYFEPHFINRPNILKFCNLMNSKSVSVLCNMCKYIRIVNMRVCPPG